MEIKEFAKSVRNGNETDRRWTVLVMLALFSSFLIFFGDGNSKGGRGTVSLSAGIVGYVVIILLSVIFAVSFCSQYTIIREDQPIMNYFLKFSEYSYLYEIVKLHAFDVKKYFWYIQKKMLVWQIVFMVCTAMTGVFYQNGCIVITAVIVSFIPSIVLFLKKQVFIRYLSRREGYLTIFIRSILYAMRWMVQVLSVVIIYLISSMLIWAVVSAVFVGDLNQAEVICRGYATNFYVMMVADLLLICACMLNMGKKSGVIRIALFVVIAVIGGINIFLEKNCYVDINMSQEKIVISDFQKKSEYSFSDISHYEIYDKDGDCTVWVTFSDKKRVKIYGNQSSTFTDKYDERYKNDEDFIRELEESFIGYGAEAP